MVEYEHGCFTRHPRDRAVQELVGDHIADHDYAPASKSLADRFN
jgi:hypothetical protein